MTEQQQQMSRLFSHLHANMIAPGNLFSKHLFPMCFSCPMNQLFIPGGRAAAGCRRPGLAASAPPPAAPPPGPPLAGNFPRRISTRPISCPVRRGAGSLQGCPSAQTNWVGGLGGARLQRAVLLSGLRRQGPRGLPALPAAAGRRATRPGQPVAGP